MPRTGPDRSLRLALRANAAFSSGCALLFVVDSNAIGPWVGLPPALLVALGVGLLGFAALLLTTSRRRDVDRLRGEARIHCAADLAWVAGSVPVVTLGWLTPAGSAALTAVSAVVLVLAVAQWRGIGASASLARA